MPTIEFVLLIFTFLVIGIIILIVLNKMNHSINNSEDNQLRELQRDIKDDISDMAGASNTLITSQLDSFSKFYDSKSQLLNTTLNDMEKGTLESLERIYRNMDNRLNSMNSSFLSQFSQMRKENNEQIDRIRSSVEEKLDKNLTTQVEKSFNSVIIHMTELQKSMTELQGLSGKVSNLDKSLNGIKTRGIMGEIQLKNLIADILAPNQYANSASTAREFR